MTKEAPPNDHSYDDIKRHYVTGLLRRGGRLRPLSMGSSLEQRVRDRFIQIKKLPAASTDREIADTDDKPVATDPET